MQKVSLWSASLVAETKHNFSKFRDKMINDIKIKKLSNAYILKMMLKDFDMARAKEKVVRKNFDSENAKL